MDILADFRGLASQIWGRDSEQLSEHYQKEREKVFADSSRRNILKSGIHFSNLLAVQKKWLRQICEALADAYLQICRESGKPLTVEVVEAIGQEVESLATRNAANLAAQLIEQLNKINWPNRENWVKNNFEYERDLVVSQIRRNLSIELGFQALRSKGDDRKSGSMVFVVMALREELDPVFENAIVPALTQFGLRPYRVDKEEFDETIANDILTRIRAARFVIADLTNERPNCYLEVGYALGIRTKVILCARDDHDPRRPMRMPDDPKVHFDLDSRKITYWRNGEMEEFRKSLISRIKAVLSGSEQETPTGALSDS